MMTVRELIIALLNFDMAKEVRLCTGETLFKIDEVENWHGTACLNFTDWREEDVSQSDNS